MITVDAEDVDVAPLEIGDGLADGTRAEVDAGCGVVVNAM
jgi:hypothetical protein